METKQETRNRELNARRRLKEIIGILARYDLIHGLTPEKLRHILEDLGPTFIKLGQILSMRSDMIPEEYCRELTKLRTDVRPMDFAEVLDVLEQEYGENPYGFFLSVDEKPLGSASIAQAHAAVLKDGTNVVVKVQRPGIYEKMAQDIRLLHKASGILKIISGAGKVIDLNTVLDEMWEVARQELDFLVEAGHIKEFTELNKEILYIAFPEVYWELTTPKVLVMECIDGIQIDDTDRLLSDGYDLKEICRKLAANYVKQVLDDGFFHADPHPGNIRIRGGKIVWIDLGMTGRLSSRDRQLFNGAMYAVAENDIYALKNAVLSIGRHSEKINHSRLYSDLEDILAKYGSLELGSIDAGQFILELIGIADGNGISMPPGVTMLGRGIITMEGVLSRINPEINLLQIVASHMAGSVFREFDLAKELKRGGKALYGFSRRAADIPGQLSDILRMAVKGQTKLNLELVGSEEPLSRINKMVDKLIISLLNAAILIGSSLLCTTDMKPKLLGIPLLGVLGYGASLVLSVWLVLGMIKKKKL